MSERELSGLNHQDTVGECHRRLGHGVGATMVMTAGLTQRAQSAAAPSSGHCIQCAERPVKGKKPWMTDKRTCESHTRFRPPDAARGRALRRSSKRLRPASIVCSQKLGRGPSQFARPARVASFTPTSSPECTS
jgi:hypothetical protein